MKSGCIRVSKRKSENLLFARSHLGQRTSLVAIYCLEAKRLKKIYRIVGLEIDLQTMLHVFGEPTEPRLQHLCKVDKWLNSVEAFSHLLEKSKQFRLCLFVFN